jgi:hypothetical protein
LPLDGCAIANAVKAVSSPDYRIHVRLRTYRNTSGCPKTKYSIQLRPKAMMFDATITMMLNRMSSRGPHTRSRYLAAAGRATTEMMN